MIMQPIYHPLNHTFSFKKVGRMYFLNLEVKGLKIEQQFPRHTAAAFLVAFELVSFVAETLLFSICHETYLLTAMRTRARIRC